ncbi:hypothetical protein SORBI_3005G067600 [Sorghum bicolor]|uniref:Uncharacterized protein n=1 Tax=Sorghum bicolor TaxID=4558 RepID=A0A1B6PQL1_SORBI|nr:hypothetical protein SORBI_3005G067600 [Sorghum bicolor]
MSLVIIVTRRQHGRVQHLQLRPVATAVLASIAPHPSSSSSGNCHRDLGTSSSGHRRRPPRHLQLRPASPHHTSPGPNGCVSTMVSSAWRHRSRARPRSARVIRSRLA